MYGTAERIPVDSEDGRRKQLDWFDAAYQSIVDGINTRDAARDAIWQARLDERQQRIAYLETQRRDRTGEAVQRNVDLQADNIALQQQLQQKNARIDQLMNDDPDETYDAQANAIRDLQQQLAEWRQEVRDQETWRNNVERAWVNDNAQLQQQVQALREALVKVKQFADQHISYNDYGGYDIAKADTNLYYDIFQEVDAALAATQPAGGPRGLNLPLLEAKFDAALEFETAESLNEFLDRHRKGRTIVNQPCTPDSPEVVALWRILFQTQGQFRETECEHMAAALNAAKEAGRAEAQAWIPVTPETILPDVEKIDLWFEDQKIRVTTTLKDCSMADTLLIIGATHYMIHQAPKP